VPVAGLSCVCRGTVHRPVILVSYFLQRSQQKNQVKYICGAMTPQHTQRETISMKKIYTIGHCTTSLEIFKETGLDQLIGKEFILQNIKFEKITPAQLDEMKKLAGSYEALFSRRAIKYKEWKLKDKSFTEKDYRQYILDEYTFLKRPVIIINDKIFVGSEKKTVAALKLALH
jgi:arsenate reductase (glutaredoxin)